MWDSSGNLPTLIAGSFPDKTPLVCVSWDENLEAFALWKKGEEVADYWFPTASDDNYEVYAVAKSFASRTVNNMAIFDSSPESYIFLRLEDI